MKKHFYGGQAVIEGVMIRGRSNCVVAVRNSQNKIILNQIPIPSFSKPFGTTTPVFSQATKTWGVRPDSSIQSQ